MAIKNTAKGNPIVINDSTDMALVDFKAYGQSKQAKYNGINLIDYAKAKSNVNNVEIKQIGNQLSITNDNNYVAIVDIPMILDVGTYYLSVSSSPSSIPIYRNGSWFANGILANSKKGTFKVTEQDVYNARINVQAKSTSLIDSLMCCTFESADYEPYTGGKPSPSPDYPQEINPKEISEIRINGEDNKVQSVVLSEPISLNGIPVSSGGNVTIDGQQYISDVLCEKDGVIGIERHCGYIEHYIDENIGDTYISTTGELSQGASVLYKLETSTFEPLPYVDQQAIRTISTNYLNTIIQTGTYAEATYVVDTKSYIDNKLLTVQKEMI